ncbi:hypothetical protein BD289DRAFT_443913 [Coniella lustricola]|uniref:Uncharacterized protein n=1 Tax=Coniella lustricola TaxID=2025994 RepID=A0A2T2ZWK3_9PEZI|nr:hypothetical protein BD289DRAFT_443913 [Coniella lustricola]
MCTTQCSPHSSTSTTTSSSRTTQTETESRTETHQLTTAAWRRRRRRRLPTISTTREPASHKITTLPALAILIAAALVHRGRCLCWARPLASLPLSRQPTNQASRARTTSTTPRTITQQLEPAQTLHPLLLLLLLLLMLLLLHSPPPQGLHPLKLQRLGPLLPHPPTLASTATARWPPIRLAPASTWPASTSSSCWASPMPTRMPMPLA